MVLVTVGCDLLWGLASIRNPVKGSSLERQVSVKELSVTLVTRTRRGALNAALRGNRSKLKKICYTMSEVCRRVYLWRSTLPCSVVASASAGLLVTVFFRA